MPNYKKIFKGKKVTIMGLGLLGGAVNDARFLAECGADLTITDLKSEQELTPSIKKLAKFKGIKYVLGHHDLEDFKKADFILQPGNVPMNSPYLEEARKNRIPIHESESLFMQYADGVKVVGITGTRGKTTTTFLIYEILKSFFGKKVHLGGNVKGKSTLSLLKEIKAGDIVVLELDSWCLHGFGDIKKSPNVSIFTNLLSDHLNYYLKGSRDEKEAEQKYFQDKAQIYLNQKEGDYLICGEKISDRIGRIKSQKIIAKKSDVPEGWKLKIPGEHNLENIACAIRACEVMSVPLGVIKKAVENFTGVEGRLQLIREYKGVKIYNDTTATTPDATIMALRALGKINQGEPSIKKRMILILGGSDKNLNMSGLVNEIPKYCREVFLLDGTGSQKLLANSLQLKALNLDECLDLKTAVRNAIKIAKKGDVLLFSPAFASFGMFANEFDRGDKFVRIIKSLK